MIAVLDYGVGNLRSLRNAFDYVGIEVELVIDPSKLETATHVVLPGVGAFGRAMSNLRAAGFVEALRTYVASGRPLLGICLGMQLLASESLEFGRHAGLGFVPGRVVPLETSVSFPVPHVGWNGVEAKRRHPVLGRAKRAVDYYFVHSFYFSVEDDADVVGTTEYGRSFASVVARENVIGCQFHPEKSQAGGLAILEGFAEWDGKGAG